MKPVSACGAITPAGSLFVDDPEACPGVAPGLSQLRLDRFAGESQAVPDDLVDPPEGRLDLVPREPVNGKPGFRGTVVAGSRHRVAIAYGRLEQPPADLRGDAGERLGKPARAQEKDGSEQCRAGPVRDAADDRVIAPHRAPEFFAVRHACS